MNRIQINEKILRQFPPSERYLVGVSGGRDSVALLHLLATNGYRDLVVCHLDHRLRGRSSAADARFVEMTAPIIFNRARRWHPVKSKGRGRVPSGEIDVVSRAVDVRAFAAKKKMSIETAARTCRYDFFARVAKRKRCSTIFLAHHGDDLVETFLLNLVRGTGMTGLAAMRAVTTRTVGNVDLTIVRPLLGFWRADVDAYVRVHRLKYREDASNKLLDPLRNRIRHRVLPFLERTTGRNVRQNIWRTAMIAAEEEDFWNALLPRQVSTLAVKSLEKMSTALQRRTLRQWLLDAKVADVGFDLIERVRALADSAAGVAKTNLPKDRHARRRAGKLFLE